MPKRCGKTILDATVWSYPRRKVGKLERKWKSDFRAMACIGRNIMWYGYQNIGVGSESRSTWIFEQNFSTYTQGDAWRGISGD